MARAGLDKNRKFQRLAHGLNAILPGMAPVLARGLLETLWSAAYERADDHLGDADDVEIAAGWTGARGMLANLLLVAGGDTATGFIEADEDLGGYKVHAFWEHAPPWVKVKADRTAARAAAGKTISDVRRESGKASQFKPAANGQPVAGQTVNPLPESMRQKSTRDGTGRDGTGIPPVSPASGGAETEQAPAPKSKRGQKQAAALAAHRAIASQVFAAFNAERVRLRIGRALDETDAHLSEIVKRLADGATLDECLRVVRGGADEVEGGSDAKWFNPATLFRASTWTVRLAAAPDEAPPRRTYTAEEIAAADEKAMREGLAQLQRMVGDETTGRLL